MVSGFRRMARMNFDNDGTLCEYAWPNIGAEKENVTAYVRKKKKDGWIVILWTNRTGKHLAEAVEWCHKKDIHLDAVNENPAHTKLWIQMSGIEESQKIFVCEYLDNKKLYVLYFRS